MRRSYDGRAARTTAIRKWLRCATVSLPGIAVRRTASLPLAYDPAIHPFRESHSKMMDARVKPAHDDLFKLY
jgi:hypothetical protein